MFLMYVFGFLVQIKTHLVYWIVDLQNSCIKLATYVEVTVPTMEIFFPQKWTPMDIKRGVISVEIDE